MALGSSGNYGKVGRFGKSWKVWCSCSQSRRANSGDSQKIDRASSYLLLTYDFSRKRSEGFPFIVGGLGVGPVFASFALARRRVVVASSWPRRGVVVNSLPCGKALGGVMCGCCLLRLVT